MGDLIVQKGNHELTTTPHMVFSVNYYLDICCTIPFLLWISSFTNKRQVGCLDTI
jgi:hypothetical protein